MEESRKQEIIKKYKELGSVWKVGECLGLTGQTVHEHLTKWGEINKMNYFTKEDEQVLLDQYEFYKSMGNLQVLADKLGRTKQFIARKAGKLGLTQRSSGGGFFGDRKKHGEKTKKWIAENGHPKGMKGKKHTNEFKIEQSERVKKMWDDPKSKVNSQEYRQKKSDYMTKWQNNRPNKGNNYSRTKKGWWEKDGRKYYMRSSWEFNYAYYLDFLVDNKEIKCWEYEVDTFWFEKIKRGVRSYTPDFKVTTNDGEIEYHEVKGWMDAKSKTKLNRMRIYHPNVKMVLIDEKRYKAIMKNKALFLK
jgi:hypothetical protein